MLDPPVLGATQVMVAEGALALATPATLAAPGAAGAAGSVETVIEVDADDAVLVPSPLVAVTVKV